jgi:hypothetical protein
MRYRLHHTIPQPKFGTTPHYGGVYMGKRIFVVNFFKNSKKGLGVANT